MPLYHYIRARAHDIRPSSKVDYNKTEISRTEETAAEQEERKNSRTETDRAAAAAENEKTETGKNRARQGKRKRASRRPRRLLSPSDAPHMEQPHSMDGGRAARPDRHPSAFPALRFDYMQ